MHQTQAKTIFVHIPRSGGTSVSSSMTFKMPKGYESIKHKPKKHEKLSGYEDYIKAVSGIWGFQDHVVESKFREFFIFTCIRKPADRLFSHWFGQRSAEYKQWERKPGLNIRNWTEESIYNSFNSWIEKEYLDELKDDSNYKMVKNPYCDFLTGKYRSVTQENHGSIFFLVTEHLNRQWPDFVNRFHSHLSNTDQAERYVKVDQLVYKELKAGRFFADKDYQSFYGPRAREIFMENNSLDVELYSSVVDKLKRKKKH